MKNWTRHELKFAVKSLNLNAPIDLLPDGDVPYLNNVRINRQGQPEPRHGVAAYASISSAIHSIKRMNNESPNNTGPAFTRFIGASTDLYSGDATLTSIDSGYDGNPLSFVTMNQSGAQFPYMYIGSSTKMAKVDVNSNVLNMGIREPTTPPSAVIYGSGNINVGTGTPYVYAYTYYNSATGAESNPSPIILPVNAVSPVNQSVTVTVSFAGADVQVDTARIWRMGGSIFTFRLVGTIPSTTTVFLDNNADLSIETALLMQTDNFVPFVSVDYTHNGTCDVTSGVVDSSAYPSSDPFNTNWPGNTVIFIDGQPYNCYGPPASATTLTAYDNTGVAPPNATGVAFQVIQPEIVSAPLEFLWGPYGGGFSGTTIFGCGDARRPGSLYWTKGNNPDSNPENNRLDITSASETLQNGCLWNGTPFVFSNLRLFQIYPDLVNAGNFLAQEIPNGKGLFARWAIVSGPAGIFFLSEDGIYVTQGGPPVSITDAKLRPLFSSQGGNGETVNGIPAPDLTQEQSLRLTIVDSILYFDYFGIDGTPHTLLYDMVANFWLHDTLNCCSSTEKQVYCRYQDEGQGANEEFIGTAAHLCLVGGSDTDFGGTLNCEFQTPCYDLGDPRTEKLFGDAMIDIDASTAGGVTCLVKTNLNSTIVGTYSLLSPAGREQFILDILDPSNPGENYAVYGKNISLYLNWFVGQQISLYGWSFTWNAKAEVTDLRPSDFTDEGFVGDKRFYGVVIRANTFGITRTVQIWVDGVYSGVNLSVNHAGELEKPYSFTPFIGHELRLFPVDSNSWEFFEQSVRWLKDDYPENSLLQKDLTDQAKPGAKYFRQILIEGDTQGSPVTVQIIADGAVNQTITVNQYGKSEVAYPLAPFVAAEVSTVPLGLIRNFAEHWMFDPYPDLASTYTAIDDKGKPGAKYFRQLLLEGDTGGASVALRIYADGALSQTITVALTGKSEFPYPVVPFTANEIQLAPLGPCRIFSQNWTFDAYPDFAETTTEYENANVVGAKYIYGVVIEADTDGNDVVVTVQSDAEIGLNPFTFTANHDGRSEKTYSFAPIVAHLMRYVPGSAWALFKFRWIFDPWPEFATLIPDFNDQGYIGDKYFRGLVLCADTGNAAVNLYVVTDDGTTQATLSVTLNGRTELPYAFTPFTGHEVRLIPSAPIRFFSARWVFDQYAEYAPIDTAITDQEKPGAKYFRQLLLEADTEGNDVVVAIYADGAFVQNLTINQTGRTEFPYPVTPFTADEIQLIPAGAIRIFKQVWTFDPYPDYAATTSEWDNAGVIGAKYVYGVVIEADTQNNSITVAVQSDAEIGSTSFNLTVQHNGRIENPYAFSPIVAHLLRFVPSGPWSLFRYKFIFDPWPEYSPLIPDFNDDGVSADKWYEGVVITADTDNNVVDLAVVTDDGVTQTTISVQHNGKQERPYSFTPFIGHQLHLVPSAPIRFFAGRWVHEPLPELTPVWTTQLTSLGMRGFAHARDAYITLQSSATVTMVITYDSGATQTYTIPSTGGLVAKVYLVVAAVKSKMIGFSLTSSAGFRLFKKDVELRMKPWGSTEGYQILRPFGEESFNSVSESGARI